MEEKKKTLDNGLYEIQAGQTVKKFLSDINDNFNNVQTAIEGAPKKIKISTDIPSGGDPGDIWIVYEE